MKCREAEKKIYLYRELSENEQRELDQHIATCASCRLLQQNTQRIEVLMKRANNVRIQPRNPELLTNRIMTSIKKKEAHQTFLSTFIQYVESYFVKYSFAALSIFLVAVFVKEYSQKEVILQQNLAEKQNGPTLNTAAVHEKFQQRRQHKEDQPVSYYAYYKKLYTEKSI
jgi:uncharacterized membrane-anchored protein YjiN (DUF445 family)